MHPSSSFNTTANKTESVVDNSTIISSGGGRKAEENVTTMKNNNIVELVKLTSDGDDKLEMSLVKMEDVEEDFETEDDDSDDDEESDDEEEELDEEEGTLSCCVVDASGLCRGTADGGFLRSIPC